MDGRVGVRTHREVVYVVELTDAELMLLKTIVNDPGNYESDTGKESADDFTTRTDIHMALSCLELEKNRLEENAVLLTDTPIQFYCDPKTGEPVTIQKTLDKIRNVPQYSANSKSLKQMKEK